MPTGASTATLQTTGNTSLNSIDTKTPALSGGRVPVEFWTVAGKFGDCEDYALSKRNALLNAGWSKDKLGLCVCYAQSGEGHCVLWVETDKGSFILDNNYDFVN